MAFFARPQSSAVKIVAPSSNDSPSTTTSPKPKKDTERRQCRNILIYGSCKYQDKGCVYYHPPRDPSPPLPDSPTPAPANTASPSLPAQAVNAPVFVPKHPASPTPAPAVAAAFSIPSPPSSPQSQAQSQYAYNGQYDPAMYDSNVETVMPMGGLIEQFQSMAIPQNPYEQYDQTGSPMLDYGMGNSDLFYVPQSAFIRQPLNYHLYSLPRPDALTHRYFISDDIREELHRRSETIHTSPVLGLGLPDELQGYHSLVPLEVTGPSSSGTSSNPNGGQGPGPGGGSNGSAGDRRKFGNWYSTVYRAVKASDGVVYALRRIEGFRMTHQAAFNGIEAWSRVKHPGLISVNEAFTTRAFNDNSLVVVYEYHPNSQTLHDVHIKTRSMTHHNRHAGHQNQGTRVPERTVWSYVIQIASAIKAVHEAGLAVRVLDATKVLVTSKNRVRISSCGVVDVLSYDPTRHPHAQSQDLLLAQQEDLTMFGKLIFSLCCSNSVAAMNNLPKAIENMGRHYGADLRKVAVWLVSGPGPHKNIGQLFNMIAPQLVTELDDSLSAVDRYEGELQSELENGRLVRLMSKLGFINERPEFALDHRWSETGDRYILKLFRDYVFHQVDERGQPVVNLGHVLMCLNKVDTGTDEKIMLISRDEQSCLVVSYRDIKACIESAFNELAVPPTPLR